MSLGLRRGRHGLLTLAPLVVLTAVLAGCASVPAPSPAPGPADPLAQSYTGRLAVRVEGDAARSFSSGFDLQGTDRAGRLSLTSPLGTQVGQAVWQPGDVRLQTGDGERQFDSLDDLARSTLGDDVPIGALFDWLAGRPWAYAPSTPLPVAGDAGFQQLGWTVRTGRLLADGLLVAERPAPSPAVTVRIKLDTP